MVSLINFKLVGDELQQQATISNAVTVEVRGSGQQQVQDAKIHHRRTAQQQQRQQQQQLQQQQQQQQHEAASQTSDQQGATGDLKFPVVAFEPLRGQQQQVQAFEPDASQPKQADGCEQLQSNFVVTWRNLSFAIEPKWHRRLVAACQLSKKQPASSVEQGSASSDLLTKVVLDKLDGSFRSGELTAILGPSGAGKTTLLDCLTGHKKTGLSGSVRISDAGRRAQTSSLISGNGAHLRSPRHFQQQQQQQTVAGKATGAQQLELIKPGGEQARVDNLKVSIIPQNDHLMGHLTVYETLNYASKMKNCFDGAFNHKLNVRRITQQLGLVSCLSTRVNKLSGGQYKRVSIAQELLSSPDILILDEPTSGLDAMTCFQTVQVLRKLTDDRQASGLKQMAVILTIHQPNSDVFQQFNHVYVVAQGGKCIYEGPPASIESAINRVGIRLPSSGYNPATLIVEVAAAKFGLEPIEKLNAIQKKQYELASLADEQNSTGDSAVDCPSISSNDDSYEDDNHNHDDDQDDEDNNKGGKPGPRRLSEINNNNSGGLVNGGFEMDAEHELAVMCPAKGTSSELAEDVGSAREPKIVASSPSECDQEARRKRRRRARRRSVGGGQERKQPDSASFESNPSLRVGGATGCDKGGFVGFTALAEAGEPRREKRLKLNSLKADQRFPFWRHTYLHFHRSWLSIVRDPMLCSMQLALHIIVPVMVSLVYGSRVGKPNACPRAGPMDIMAYALEPQDSALQLQEDLRTTLENIGYIFFKLYGIIFAAMTVTVLTFPLDMHVLVKEFRNGWYGLSSYFIGRTLADVPFQLTLPFLAMSLSYYATGQPYSHMQWRFLSITGILILSSLIAQSQGLLFGAILMDKMKAAVFVAPAATTPIILFAGFLVRTKSIPSYLRPLSNLSYLRYAIEACLISRYGFNQCECDPAIFNQTVPELPPIARSMLDYWLGSFRLAAQADSALPASNGSLIETTTTTLAEDRPDLFTKLIESLAKANSFGRNITTCEQVVPYPMIDYDLKDSHLFDCFAILIFMLVFTRLLTFFIVCFKVKKNV